MVSGAAAAANNSSIVFACLVLLVTGAGFAKAVLHVLGARGGRIQTITTVHPLYLVHAKPQLVQLHPLFMLTGTHGVHQHNNGAYTHTSLTFTFGEPRDRWPALVPALPSRDRSSRRSSWTRCSRCAGRSLELLAEGALEAEHLVDNLPPRVLGDLPRPPGAIRGYLAPLAMGLVAAMLVAVPTLVGSTGARGTSRSRRPRPRPTRRRASRPTARTSRRIRRGVIARSPPRTCATCTTACSRGCTSTRRIRRGCAREGGRTSSRSGRSSRHPGRGRGRRVRSQCESAPWARTSIRRVHIAGLGGLLPTTRRRHRGGAPSARVVVRLKPGPAKTLTSGTATLEARGAIAEVCDRGRRKTDLRALDRRARARGRPVEASDCARGSGSAHLERRARRGHHRTRSSTRRRRAFRVQMSLWKTLVAPRADSSSPPR